VTRRLAKPRPVQGEQAPPPGCPPRSRVRRSSLRGTGGPDGWSPPTESGLQACYGKSPGDRALSMDPPRRRLVRLGWRRGRLRPLGQLGAVARLCTHPSGHQPRRASAYQRGQCASGGTPKTARARRDGSFVLRRLAAWIYDCAPRTPVVCVQEGGEARSTSNPRLPSVSRTRRLRS
jgi:hypothetical protein